MPFTSLGLSPTLLKALEENNYAKPFPIQEKAIPAILKQRDVLGIAPTGSGKTASYVLPLLMNLQGVKITKNRHINALVLVPTRELAVQVNDVFKQFSSAQPNTLRSMAVFGGPSINPQMKALMGVNILVATPGRLLELIDNKAVHLSDIKALVLDEADKLLNLGFSIELDRILELLPPKRQNLLFSATLNQELSTLNKVLLQDPVVIKVEPKDERIELINQQAYSVKLEKKGPLLRHLLREKNWPQVLIFTSSIHQADNVVDKLRKNGIFAMATHSKKSHGARTLALSEFKSGKLQILVATDLLSRGIDIEFLPCVINYELPRSPKDFVHRIGRTGRAESPGDAISFVTEDDRHHFKVIQKKMKTWAKLIDSEEMDF